MKKTLEEREVEALEDIAKSLRYMSRQAKRPSLERGFPVAPVDHD